MIEDIRFSRGYESISPLEHYDRVNKIAGILEDLEDESIQDLKARIDHAESQAEEFERDLYCKEQDFEDLEKRVKQALILLDEGFTNDAKILLKGERTYNPRCVLGFIYRWRRCLNILCL